MLSCEYVHIVLSVSHFPFVDGLLVLPNSIFSILLLGDIPYPRSLLALLISLFFVDYPDGLGGVLEEILLDDHGIDVGESDEAVDNALPVCSFCTVILSP